jgi:dipeptidyl aminopeptidase/acylaminoacyl peptidase
MLAEKTVGLGSVAVDGDDVYWLEARWSDGGRYVLVRRTPDGVIADVTAAPHNVRTRVHEYGGGAYAVHNGTVWYSNIADGRVYRLDVDGDLAPRPITPEGVDMRYADLHVDARRRRLLCVREDHENLAPSSTPGQGERPPEARNTVVALPWNGGEQRVLAQGADFYAAPRVGPGGERVCWLSWNHPNMPWDGCELWEARCGDDGGVSDVRLVAGGPAESIFQPSWSPDGVLHFVSDRSGWWNLYRHGEGEVEALTAEPAEFGEPTWIFGMSRYDFDGPTRIVCSSIAQGMARLGVLDTATQRLTPVPLPYTDIGPTMRVGAGRAYFTAASASAPRAVVQLDVATGATTVLRSSAQLDVDPAYISPAQALEYPTENGRTAHAFYYAPGNPEHSVPEGERPPLLVRTHGGPTSLAPAGFDLEVQFWTSRGFAFLDVNYGGSSGFGREYRQRLDGNWGIVDVDDCVNGALHLARQGLVDGHRLVIDGGSAGGYTTLAALAFRDTFAAGASYFGVADLERLAVDTHKFESRYLDRLVGPYPAMRDLYLARSPVHHTERLERPVILFQGLDDKVVPPSQAEAMFAAVRDKGLPCAYLPFAGEDHGFRRAESIVRSHEAELSFYAQVFDFEPADAIDPVPIENL